MGLWEDSDKLGQEVQAKQAAEAHAKEMAKQAAAKAAAAQKQHQEDKEQGMI